MQNDTVSTPEEVTEDPITATHMGDTFAVQDGKVVDLTPDKPVENPEKGEDAPPAEAKNSEDEPEDKTGDTGDPDKDKDGEDKDKKSRAQDRIRELVDEKNKEREEKLAERDARIAAEAKAELLEKQLRGEKPEENDAPDGPAPRPLWSVYEAAGKTAEEYEEDLIKWATKPMLEEIFTKFEQEKAKSETADTVNSLVGKAREVYPDFDTVAGPSSPLAPIMQANPYMAQATMEHENFADISHYLGSNLAEAERISGLSPLRAAAEIGRIGAEISTAQKKAEPETPAVKRETAAPEPVEIVSPKGGATEPDMESMSIDDWMKKRNKQVKRR